MWGIHRIWGNHRIFAYETKYSAEVSSIFFPVYFFEMYSVFKNLILRLFKNIIYFPEYKFKYIFHNPMGDCDQLKLHSSHLLEDTDPNLNDIFLFGDASFSRAFKTQILKATIKYILSTKRFGQPLFYICGGFSILHK